MRRHFIVGTICAIVVVLGPIAVLGWESISVGQLYQSTTGYCPTTNQFGTCGKLPQGNRFLAGIGELKKQGTWRPRGANDQPDGSPIANEAVIYFKKPFLPKNSYVADVQLLLHVNLYRGAKMDVYATHCHPKDDPCDYDADWYLGTIEESKLHRGNWFALNVHADLNFDCFKVVIPRCREFEGECQDQALQRGEKKFYGVEISQHGRYAPALIFTYYCYGSSQTKDCESPYMLPKRCRPDDDSCPSEPAPLAPGFVPVPPLPAAPPAPVVCTGPDCPNPQLPGGNDGDDDDGDDDEDDDDDETLPETNAPTPVQSNPGETPVEGGNDAPELDETDESSPPDEGNEGHSDSGTEDEENDDYILWIVVGIAAAITAAAIITAIVVHQVAQRNVRAANAANAAS